MPSPKDEIAVRRTLGGGYSIYIRGNEIIYISPEEAKKERTLPQMLGDMSKRLRQVRDKGGITTTESTIIMHLIGQVWQTRG